MSLSTNNRAIMETGEARGAGRISENPCPFPQGGQLAHWLPTPARRAPQAGEDAWGLLCPFTSGPRPLRPIPSVSTGVTRCSARGWVTQTPGG